jgi:cytochrome c oxidase assembly factor CtaG
MPCAWKAVEGIGLGTALSLAMLTPLSTYLDSSLTLHMIVEHFIFVVAGFSFGFGLSSLALVGSLLSVSIQSARDLVIKLNSALNKRGLATFVLAGVLVAYWQIPKNFDATTLSEGTHLVMHLTFLMVGALVYFGSKALTRTTRQVAPVVVGKIMGGFGVVLLITQAHMYLAYPFSEQSEAGLVMVTIMLVIDFMVAPYWLYNYFRAK